MIGEIVLERCLDVRSRTQLNTLVRILAILNHKTEINMYTRSELMLTSRKTKKILQLTVAGEFVEVLTQERIPNVDDFLTGATVGVTKLL